MSAAFAFDFALPLLLWRHTRRIRPITPLADVLLQPQGDSDACCFRAEAVVLPTMQLPVQNSWGIGELWTLSPVVPNGQRYRKLSRSVGSVGRRSLGCNAQYRFTPADQAKRPGFLCKLSRTSGGGGPLGQVPTRSRDGQGGSTSPSPQ